MIERKIQLPLDIETIQSLKAGESVLLTGTMITGRDAAHQRLFEAIQNHQELPINIEGEVIYYVGPAPSKPGYPVGSAGPTSSYRMDKYAPILIEKGLKGMIGKGNRSKEVIDAMKKHQCVYFAAIGGLGAMISKSIMSSEVLCYEDLGPEAIHRFWVKDFPAIVVIDSFGNNLYELEQAKYRELD
jgi:fumarate hydratase subunit beta